MAKVIKYKFLVAEINHGTEENPDIEQIILDAEIVCHAKSQYEANLPVAEKEAIPGTLDPDENGEFDPEPEIPETGDVVTWAALNAAYQEGVDSV